MDKPRVLCVDNDLADLGSLTRLLTLNGYQVFPCDHPQRALKILREMRPDAVIADILMPSMNGIDLTEWIRARFHGTIPVISKQSDPGETLAALDEVLKRPLEHHSRSESG